jgi:hypothetical protein
MRLKRQNFAWLTALGAAVGIAVLSGAGGALVTVTLLGLYLAAAAASVIDVQPERIIDRSRSSLTAMRMSAEAREAVERAHRRGSTFDAGLTLLDVGLITAQSNRDGMVMRRTRSVSLDDDGVRPFITLHVQPENAEQIAVIRFEIIDGNGTSQYVHEMRTFLRDGEMNILADHQLPLVENAALQSGDWDLRVFVDGKLLGAHLFTLAPSLNNRFERLEQRDQQQRSAASTYSAPAQQQPDKEETPLSLEDLLRSRSSGGGSSSNRSS